MVPGPLFTRANKGPGGREREDLEEVAPLNTLTADLPPKIPICLNFLPVAEARALPTHLENHTKPTVSTTKRCKT